MKTTNQTNISKTPKGLYISYLPKRSNAFNEECLFIMTYDGHKLSASRYSLLFFKHGVKKQVLHRNSTALRNVISLLIH